MVPGRIRIWSNPFIEIGVGSLLARLFARALTIPFYWVFTFVSYFLFVFRLVNRPDTTIATIHYIGSYLSLVPNITKDL